MMTAEQLKGSILQLAMQGKLVEQREEEGTGEELYKRIQEEKKRLVKEGKIKKEKSSTVVTSEDNPMDIPDSWIWVSFGDLFDIGSAIRIHQTDWKKEGIPFFRGRELVRLAKTGDPDAEIFITQELYEKNKAKGGVPQKGDLLVSAVGTIGKVYIVKGTKPFYYKDAYILRFNNFGQLYSKYFQYVIESPFEQAFIKEGSMGTTVAQLTIMKAKRMMCPLPPLEEQKRIVAKIEELMPFVEQYAASSTKLNTLNTSFPDQMKKSILQEAVQGKLVPQDPNDEPASALLKKIAEEKKRLIKERKIKKQKPLPEITEDEIPFEIPESWEWVRFGSVMNVVSARRVHQSDWKKRGIPFYRAREIAKLAEADRVENELYISEDLYKEFSKSGVPKPGDLMVTGVGTLGKTYVVKEEDKFYYKDASVLCFENFAHLDPYYIKRIMESPLMRGQIKSNSSGTTVATLTMVRMVEYLIPLPPLAEQKRIAMKIEELIPFIEELNR